MASEQDKSDMNDTDLESLLDTIDERTVQQQILHDCIADGFMALARERYSNPASLERLGHLVYDNREELKANMVVRVEASGKEEAGEVVMSRYVAGIDEERGKLSGKGSDLRRRNVEKGVGVEKVMKRGGGGFGDVKNNFIAIPSVEVREAIRCFRMAADRSIEVANVNGKIEGLISRLE